MKAISSGCGSERFYKAKNIKRNKKHDAHIRHNTLLQKRNHVPLERLEIGNENCNMCNANRHEISELFRSNKRTSCDELREMPHSNQFFFKQRHNKNPSLREDTDQEELKRTYLRNIKSFFQCIKLPLSRRES